MAQNKKPILRDRLFRALADRTRLRLLNLMENREICVCYLVEVLQTNQPKVSRHLAYLRSAGVVSARRQGKWMHYRVSIPTDPCAARILQQVQAWLSADEEMQRDRARLTKVCCKPERFVRLQNAPLPAPVAQVGAIATDQAAKRI